MSSSMEEGASSKIYRSTMYKRGGMDGGGESLL